VEKKASVLVDNSLVKKHTVTQELEVLMNQSQRLVLPLTICHWGQGRLKPQLLGRCQS